MGMNGTRRVAALAVVAAWCLILGTGVNAQAPAAAPAQDAAGAKPAYTMAEYNSYTACQNEKVPAQQIKCLDDFVSKYPSSSLLNFVYTLYMQAYSQEKGYLKVIDYSDKMAALGDKIDAAAKFNAYYTHAAAYAALIAADKTAAADVNLAKSARDAAIAGLKVLADVKKPDNVADDAWATQKRNFQLFLNGVSAQASNVMKDNAGAVTYYKAILTINPDDAISDYQLGQVYLRMTPPQPMDAFWYIGRAVTSKTATADQSKKVKDYLRKLIANYQGGNVCDTLIDAELNELLQLAGSSAERSDSYKLYAAADLETARKDMTIASVTADLKAGGEKAKVTWLASCGLEFPEVPGKLLEVAPSADAVQLKVAFVTSEAEFNAATVPNMDVKVLAQPEAAKLEKDNVVHFTGTLVSYDPDPAFMIHWDKAKVSADDLPKEEKKPAPRKPAPRRPAAKKP